MVSGFVGARLFHVFYENFDYYLENPINILTIWNGGFVFYGGAIGVLIATSVFIRIKKMNFLRWADLFAPVFAFGYAIGRFGCFLNGCCFGKQCSLPWAIQFPSHNVDYTSMIARHPTQLYTLLIELIILVILLKMESFTKKSSSLFANWMKPYGQVFFLWATLHGLNRLFMELFRDDFRGQDIFNFSVSSWLSIAIVLTAAHFLFHHGRRALKTSSKTVLNSDV
jgi:phosphatidylglycerol:prolipoprotein diacylglycerol transferase